MFKLYKSHFSSNANHVFHTLDSRLFLAGFLYSCGPIRPTLSLILFYNLYQEYRAITLIMLCSMVRMVGHPTIWTTVAIECWGYRLILHFFSLYLADPYSSQALMSPAAASSSAALAGTLENRHLQLLTRIISRTTGKPKPFIKKIGLETMLA